MHAQRLEWDRFARNGNKAAWAFCRFWITNVPWWRHQMEPFSALLAICAGNSPVTGERPMVWTFDVFFDPHLINGWVINDEAEDLRRHHAHHDVIVMTFVGEMGPSTTQWWTRRVIGNAWSLGKLHLIQMDSIRSNQTQLMLKCYSSIIKLMKGLSWESKIVKSYSHLFNNFT